MSSYRFCRTDDIGLLVDALNRCWAPHVPGEPLMTPAAFKRSIRDLQVWCSSCMVAFADGDPIAVLIGAKRSSATFVHRIAVHPDHQRQGHGRHLLSSLGSKLAILGPPRIEAEVPEGLTAARALFTAAGYAEDAILTDYVLRDGHEIQRPAIPGRLVIPVTVDDLDANRLLEPGSPACPAAARSARGGEPGNPACPAAARSARGGEPGSTVLLLLGTVGRDPCRTERRDLGSRSRLG